MDNSILNLTGFSQTLDTEPVVLTDTANTNEFGVRAFVDLLTAQTEQFSESAFVDTESISEINKTTEEWQDESGNILPLAVEFFPSLKQETYFVGSSMPEEIDLTPINQGTKNIQEHLNLKLLFTETPSVAEEVGPQLNFADLSEKETTDRLTRGFGNVDESIDNNLLQQKDFSTMSQLASTKNSPRFISEKLITTTIEQPIGKPGWTQQLGERITWLVNNAHPTAEIRLNPPELGRIDVKIEMELNQAKVMFSSQHSQVREVLESALPKLREMLATQQIQLNDVSVSQHSFAEQHNSRNNDQLPPQHSANASRTEESVDPESDDQLHPETQIGSQGILSLYV